MEHTILREMGFYFLTLMLTVSSITFVIPNISSNPQDYKTIKKIIKKTWINERPFEDKTGKHIEKTFVIQATDDYEVYVSQTNVDNWDSLVEVDLCGKSFNALLRNSNNGNLNPASLQIADKTILSFNRHLYLSYLILLMTLGCVCYSIYLISKRLNETDIATSGNSAS
ncbi:MAG: hypothetical protein EOO46_08270 [Flavobacterium sp.]|nr:MAG: hypothetical protein EOO46_08270 [Flavobacterium sp.]